MEKGQSCIKNSDQHIWAIGSGKGGVGKSVIATSFAIVLASLGKHVIAVDLDLGNANMHTLLGIKYPRRTLIDFLKGDIKNLNEIILDTSLYTLKFISGSGGIMGSANPWHAQKLKLIRYLKNLHVDHIVLDLGAGTTYNTIDFFLNATDHILVTTPETTSIQSVYNFIRICIFRKMYSLFHKNNILWEMVESAKVPTIRGESVRIQNLLDSLNSKAPDSTNNFKAFQKTFHPHLIMNMVLKKDEAGLGYGLKEVIKDYLDIDIAYDGSIAYDKIIRESLSCEIPSIINAPKARSTSDFIDIIPNILGNNSLGSTMREIIEREIKQAHNTFRSRMIESHKMDVDPSVYVIDKVNTFETPDHKESSGLLSIKSSTWSKIAIDIGTSTTQIYVKDRGIVLNEPSFISIDENTGKVVALGYEAKSMLGRSHSGMKIISPMESGSVSDYTDVRKMIQGFMKRAKKSTILIRPGVVLTIPLGLTSVERKAVQEFIEDLGAHETHLVYEPVAASVGAGLPVDVPQASMLVNIGGGSISVVVVSISGIVCHVSKRIGSCTVDRAIVRYLRDNHNFFIGDQTAEWVKINFAQVIKIKRDKRFEVRGQDLKNSIPKSLTIGSAEIREAIFKPVQDMLKVIMNLLERVPPELSGDLVDRGMVLTGGGAYLTGLDQLIADSTGIKVRIAGNAQTAAVEGAGRMLDDFKFYKKFFADTMENQIE